MWSPPAAELESDTDFSLELEPESDFEGWLVWSDEFLRPSDELVRWRLASGLDDGLACVLSRACRSFIFSNSSSFAESASSAAVSAGFDCECLRRNRPFGFVLGRGGGVALGTLNLLRTLSVNFGGGGGCGSSS